MPYWATLGPFQRPTWPQLASEKALGWSNMTQYHVAYPWEVFWIRIRIRMVLFLLQDYLQIFCRINNNVTVDRMKPKFLSLLPSEYWLHFILYHYCSRTEKVSFLLLRNTVGTNNICNLRELL